MWYLYNCFETPPHLNREFAIVVLILNIIFPGVGTIIAAFNDEKGYNYNQFWIGFQQFNLFIIIVGWFWSVWWGFLILEKASKRELIRSVEFDV